MSLICRLYSTLTQCFFLPYCWGERRLTESLQLDPTVSTPCPKLPAMRNLFKGEKINKFRGMWLYWDCWNWMRALSQVHPHQWLCWCFSPPGKSESPTSFQAGISLSRPKADGWLVGCLAGFLSVIFHRGPWDDKVKHSRSSGIGLCGLPIQILSCVYSKDPMGVWHFFLFAFLFQQAQFHLAAQFDFFIFYQGG